MRSKRETPLRRQRTNWGMKGRRLSAEVVAIDTWHDAKYRRRQFAFIQMMVPLFSLCPKMKGTKGNLARIHNKCIYFLLFFSSFFPLNFKIALFCRISLICYFKTILTNKIFNLHGI